MTAVDDADALPAAPAPRPVATTPGGVGQTSLRDQNLSVLTALAFAAPQPPSRAALAAASGLTRSTVSRLVDELLAGGILRELPRQIVGRGRPATPLAPAVRTLVGLGLEVSPSYVAARLVDLTGTVLAEELRPAHPEGSEPGEVLAGLSATAATLLSESAGSWTRLAGVRLAVPGLVEAGGRVLRAPNLGWREVEPGPHLRALAGMTEPRAGGAGGTVVANEAELAALAHALDAPGRPAAAPTFFYVSADVGIGGAFIVDGQSMGGRHGWAGEIGHTLVDPTGPLCTCGATGCLEQYAGREALLRAAGLGEGAGAAELAAAAAHPGPARDAVTRAGRALGVALANVVNLLDVDDIVLGGQFITLLDVLRPSLTAELHSRVLASPWLEVGLRPGRGGAPAPTGGAYAVLGEVVRDPARWLPDGSA